MTILSSVPADTTAYNVLFALTTGAVGSFFVSIIVELTSNYRHNKLGWYELKSYYSIVSRFEMEKQIRMGNSLSQRAKQQARKDAGLTDEIQSELDKEYQKDAVQATWKLLPQIIPVLKETLENKKAFLNDGEISALEQIMFAYHEVKFWVEQTIFPNYLYNTFNHPDVKVLSFCYPENILADMPDWLKTYIAGLESQKSMDKLVDTILSDSSLLAQCMEGYDISELSIKTSHDEYEDNEDNIKEDRRLSAKEIEEYFEQEEEHRSKLTEEELKIELQELDKKIAEKQRPFIERQISSACYSINEGMEELEKIVMKKPHYGLFLREEKELSQKSEQQLMKDEIYRIEYENEKKWLKDNYGDKV